MSIVNLYSNRQRQILSNFFFNLISGIRLDIENAWISVKLKIEIWGQGKNPKLVMLGYERINECLHGYSPPQGLEIGVRLM